MTDNFRYHFENIQEVNAGKLIYPE